MGDKITHEDYLKASEIVERYRYQEKGTIQVHVEYEATVIIVTQLPKDWSIDRIKEDLSSGPYYDMERDDADRISYGKITRLIVNGYEIK